jgi:hypothetical protein
MDQPTGSNKADAKKAIGKTNGQRLALIVGAVLIVAVIGAAIVNSLRPLRQLDPNSPEGVVQSFLVAVDEERYDSAYQLLSLDAQVDCNPSDLAVDQPEMSRVVVDEVTEFDEETLVVLDATVMEVDPIDPYTYETTLEFTLIDESGSVRIDRLPYPYFCRSN